MEECRSVFVAYLLSLICRNAIQGPVPLFLFDGTGPGVGKGLGIQTASLIAFGHDARLSTYPKDDSELRKVLTSLLIEGAQSIIFDNVAAVLGSPVLDACITSRVIVDRLLGSNKTTSLPMNAVLAATANNIAVRADTARRCLKLRMESPIESPESRSDFKIPYLCRHVRENRAKYYADVLTIARAWFLAGKPSPAGTPRFGSFR